MEQIEEHVAQATLLRGQIETGLRALLAEQDAMIARLEEFKRERDKTRRALQALGHEKAQAPKASRKAQGAPSDENLARILAAFDGPTTRAELAERSGLSGHTIMRAVSHLRAEEKIRLVKAGTRGQLGSGDQFAPMPAQLDSPAGIPAGVNGAA
jgi:CRP-like cAMP-binding protein